MIVWITGLPGSGKTTLAKQLRDESLAVLLDADDAREVMPLGFSQRDRTTQVWRLQFAAALLDHQSFDVVVACVAPYRYQREAFKLKHGAIEVYLEGGTPLDWEGAHYEEPEVRCVQLTAPVHDPAKLWADLKRIHERGRYDSKAVQQM